MILQNRFNFSGPITEPTKPFPFIPVAFPNPRLQFPLHCPHSKSFMALHLCKHKPRSLSNPSLIHLFSTSQNDNNDNNNNNGNNSSKQSSLNSYFSDVKASLKNTSQQQQQQEQRFQNPKPNVSSFSRAAPTKAASLEDLRKSLADFRQRSSVPPLTEPNTTASQSILFQGNYPRNTNNETKPSGNLTFEAIRESLRQMRSNSSNNRISSNAGRTADSLSLSSFKNTLKLKPEEGSKVLGGTEELPVAVFGREMREGRGGDREAMKTEFVKIYSYGELGDKLRKLRGEGWKGEFSLEELNERLMRLREMEEKESESRIGGILYKDLRESLVRLKISDDEKAKRSSSQGLDILAQLGQTQNFMLHPPKEHLVEKYSHPDNMSSAEKMKVELAKVREEFKMSESDCGSARVQVAQLTTKIKHLSSILHKKDKHSRKGLLAMVQRRKRLLKYLRRTDWDSYCFVLSKLGLRDNPDYKTMT